MLRKWHPLLARLFIGNWVEELQYEAQNSVTSRIQLLNKSLNIVK